MLLLSVQEDLAERVSWIRLPATVSIVFAMGFGFGHGHGIATLSHSKIEDTTHGF